jgi:hypothetical protein
VPTRVSTSFPFLPELEDTEPKGQPLSTDQVELHSPLFFSDEQLERIAQGRSTLQLGMHGQAVMRVQRALIEAGHPLNHWGADGWYGPETRTAVERFQSAQGLEATGDVDARTLSALDAAGGVAATRYPEYGELFKDGVLNATVAIGYDEDNSDLTERAQVIDGLKERGFTSKDGVTFEKPFEAYGKSVRAVVTLIDRGSAKAKQQFQRAMETGELVVYAGHARYGSGPDFDPIGSPDGNYVMGKSYAPGHVVFGANDLKRSRFTNGYQLMFFDACQTIDYLKDLRGIPRNKNAGNLDLVLSNAPISWGDASANVFIALDGVMGIKSIDEIQSSYERLNQAGFTADGFEGNRFRPA